MRASDLAADWPVELWSDITCCSCGCLLNSIDFSCKIPAKLSGVWFAVDAVCVEIKCHRSQAPLLCWFYSVNTAKIN